MYWMVRLLLRQSILKSQGLFPKDNSDIQMQFMKQLEYLSEDSIYIVSLRFIQSPWLSSGEFIWVSFYGFDEGQVLLHKPYMPHFDTTNDTYFDIDQNHLLLFFLQLKEFLLNKKKINK